MDISVNLTQQRYVEVGVGESKETLSSKVQRFSVTFMVNECDLGFHLYGILSW